MSSGCAHFVEVDLQDNLIWQWSEVCMGGRKGSIHLISNLTSRTPHPPCSLMVIHFGMFLMTHVHLLGVSSARCSNCVRSCPCSRACSSTATSSNHSHEQGLTISPCEFAFLVTSIRAYICAHVCALVDSRHKRIPLHSMLCHREHQHSFHHLRVLALNGCAIQSWASIQLLEPVLTNIEELYLVRRRVSACTSNNLCSYFPPCA